MSVASVTNMRYAPDNLQTTLKTPAKYRVSLKKRYFFDFCLISVLEVRFYFFTCVIESDFRARPIWPLKLYPSRIQTAMKMQKCMRGHDFLVVFDECGKLFHRYGILFHKCGIHSTSISSAIFINCLLLRSIMFWEFEVITCIKYM